MCLSVCVGLCWRKEGRGGAEQQVRHFTGLSIYILLHHHHLYSPFSPLLKINLSHMHVCLYSAYSTLHKGYINFTVC